MNAIDRKLLRDLGRLSGQIITVGLVVAAGLAGMVGIYSTLYSIESAKDAYYERNRFADVFVHLKKAPTSLESRLQDIPGVETLETRITESALIPLEGSPEPARARVVSLPDSSEPLLNSLHLTSGRKLSADQPDEVIVLDAFAKEHQLVPGDELPVIMGGRKRELRVVGTAMSPEFVAFGGEGEIVADVGRNAVLWLNRQAVEAAYQQDGSFNDVILGVQPGASEEEVITELDRLVEPFGGLGAIARKHQPSHAFVRQELEQLRSIGTAMPLGFLAVAAFLLNVVLARLVQLQRGEIATLKAVGYADRQIAAHFFKFVLVILALGAAVGSAVGAWMGSYMNQVYAQFFRFPNFQFHVDLRLVVIGTLVTLLVGLAGAFLTLYRVMRLPPAEAMRPPAPEIYRATVLERWGLARLLSASTRMILRNFERRPLRFFVSWIGLALAVSLLVFGRFGWDAVERLIELQFTLGQREDISVSFVEPLPLRAERSLEHLPGVHQVEAHRFIPVRFVAGHRHRDSVIVGLPTHNAMRRSMTEHGEVVVPPTSGILISRTLGDVLGVERGGQLSVRVLSGEREPFNVRIAGLVDDTFGIFGYMQMDELADKLGDEGAITHAYLRVDRERTDEIFHRLEDMPAIASTQRRDRILSNFRKQLDESTSFQTLFVVIIASVIVIGVVYNNTRVALSMRGRELASLRVLGFTRREVAYLLLAEQAVQILLALPVGFVLGGWFAELMVATVDPEKFRFPLYISPKTLGFATVVTLVSALFSGYLVRRKLDRMDLTAVLKERE